MFKKVFLTIVLTFFVFNSTAFAQEEVLPDPGMLPTSSFYFLKSWTESIGTFFTFGDVAKAERFLELSEKRLAEIDALTLAGETEAAEEVMNRYEKQLGHAFQWAEKAKLGGKDMGEVLGKVSEATFKHQGVLMNVLERVPDQAKGAIERAMQQSMRGYEESMKGMTEQERERVMQNVQEKMQEVEVRMEGLRQKGLNMPSIPNVEESSMEDVGVDEFTPNNPEIPSGSGGPSETRGPTR